MTWEGWCALSVALAAGEVALGLAVARYLGRRGEE